LQHLAEVLSGSAGAQSYVMPGPGALSP
jgi:hypothetical protein